MPHNQAYRMVRRNKEKKKQIVSFFPFNTTYDTRKIRIHTHTLPIWIMWVDKKKHERTSFESLNSIIANGLRVPSRRVSVCKYIISEYVCLRTVQCPLNFPIEIQFFQPIVQFREASCKRIVTEYECRVWFKLGMSHHYAWQWLFCVWKSLRLLPFFCFFSLSFSVFVCNCFLFSKEIMNKLLTSHK